MLARSAGSILVLITLGCGTSPAPALSDATRAAIADSLRSITLGFAEAANALEVGRIAPRFVPDADFTWAADGWMMPISRDSLMSLYRQAYAGYRAMAFAWDSLRVSVLGPEAGTVTGAGHFAVTDTTGKTVRNAVAVTYVFVRRDGGWQLLQGHVSHRVLE